MLTETQRKYLTELIGECCHKFTTPDDFFAVLRKLDAVDISKIFTIMGPSRMEFAENLKREDFIERFCHEVCKQGGIE